MLNLNYFRKYGHETIFEADRYEILPGAPCKNVCGGSEFGFLFSDVRFSMTGFRRPENGKCRRDEG